MKRLTRVVGQAVPDLGPRPTEQAHGKRRVAWQLNHRAAAVRLGFHHYRMTINSLQSCPYG